MEIAPSVLGADLLNLERDIRRAETAGVTWLHLDQMDGVFVPNISFGPAFVRAIRAVTPLTLDVHLMLSRPENYLEAYKKAGADRITIHAELPDPAGLLKEIRHLGCAPGLALRPDTPVEQVEELLHLCDLILVMTVMPGFGGQSLQEECLRKIPVLREMCARQGLSPVFEIDGGVKRSNLALCRHYGAEMLVAGTAFFGDPEPGELVRLCRESVA